MYSRIIWNKAITLPKSAHVYLREFEFSRRLVLELRVRAREIAFERGDARAQPSQFVALRLALSKQLCVWWVRCDRRDRPKCEDV